MKYEECTVMPAFTFQDNSGHVPSDSSLSSEHHQAVDGEVLYDLGNGNLP